MTLHNAPATPGPILISAALTLAALVLFAVLFTLATLHARRQEDA